MVYQATEASFYQLALDLYCAAEASGRSASAAKGRRLDFDHDIDDTSSGVGCTQLNTIRKPLNDPYNEIVDLRKWVGQHLHTADERHGGRIA